MFFCRKVVCSQSLQPLLTELGGRESGSQKPPGPVIPFYCLTQPGVSEPSSLCLLCVLYCGASRSYCGGQPAEWNRGSRVDQRGSALWDDFLTSSLVYFDSTTFVVGLREEVLLIDCSWLLFLLVIWICFLGPLPLFFLTPAFSEVTQATPARLCLMLELAPSRW